MKYEINLLPPDALTSRMLRVQKRRERTLFFAAVVSFAIILTAYGATWWSLRTLRETLSDQMVLQNKDRAVISERSRDVNRDIVAINTKVSSFTLWTSHVSEIVRAAPAGIKISRLELVEKPETFVVTGKASQGSDVVEYQAVLEKLPWVDHVVAPLQNFARAPEATVTFTIFHKKP